MLSESLVRAVLAAPDDEALRLVCADWLEEQGAYHYDLLRRPGHWGVGRVLDERRLVWARDRKGADNLHVGIIPPGADLRVLREHEVLAIFRAGSGPGCVYFEDRGNA